MSYPGDRAKGLCKALTMFLLFSGFMSGCVTHDLDFKVGAPFVAPTPKKVDLSSELTLDAPTLPPAVKFVPKPGSSDSVTIDGVTVQVTSIADLNNYRDEFKRKITLPNGNDFEFCLIPRLVALRVTNATDHIITLGQNMMLAGTIVHLEDASGRAYPLMNDWESIKAEAIGGLDEYSQKCQASMKEKIALLDAKSDEIEKEMEGFGEKELNEYVASLKGDYTAQYEDAVHRVSKWHWCRFLEVFWWLPVPCGLLVENNPIKNPGFRLNSGDDERHLRPSMLSQLDDLSPHRLELNARREVTSVLENSVYSKITSARTKLTSAIDGMSTQIEQIKNSAKREIADIPQPEDIVLNGAYQPIIILPGRSREVFVPFKKPAKDKEITEMNVYVIDLVTMMDAAGIPTKRGTFRFTMIPQMVSPSGQ